MTHVSGDALDLLLRDPGKTSLGHDPKAAPVLEVAQVMGDTLLEVRHYTDPQGQVRLGEDDADFAAPDDDLPVDGLSLFVWDGSGARLRFPATWTGFVADVSGTRTLADLVDSGEAVPQGGGVFEVVLNPGAIAHCDSGHVGFLGRIVPRAAAVPPGQRDLDAPFLGIMAFMGFLFAMLAVVLITSPPPVESSVAEVPDHIAAVIFQVPETPPPSPAKKLVQETDPDAGEGVKRELDEGKTGEKTSKMKVARGNKIELDRKQRDMDIALNAGVLGALSDAGLAAGLSGDPVVNADMLDGMGGAIGAKGIALGTGFGSRGGGLGGGGKVGQMGGGLGTQGIGGGHEGYGSEGGNFGPKQTGKTPGKLTAGTGTVLGRMDKSLIDNVIKRHLNQIKYCYQRELTKDPTLGGKIKVRFFIAPDGSVSKAGVRSSTLGSPAVESCITNRFMHFTFPEVPGGGVVIVNYPFVFAG